MSVVAGESSAFTVAVKKWRKLRKLSQMDLALDAGISQRHLSFMESGRSKPSRDMVLSLCQALDLPLRERNLFLTGAGFAPVFKERSLECKDMEVIDKALEMSLAHHEPYPAIVADRNWNLLKANQAAIGFMGLLGELEQVWQKVDPKGEKNIYRMTFHPSGMRPLISNWPELARTMLLRLQREVASDPDNTSLQTLLSEVTELSGIDLSIGLSDMINPLAPILPMELNAGGITLKVFSMISTFGTALDITAEELKIETFFPADEFTENFFRRISAQSS